MKTGLIYIIEWAGIDSLNCFAKIFDTSVQIEDSETAETVYLTGSGTPCVITSVNNGRDKLYPIVGKTCTLQFRPTSEVNIRTFASGADNRFYVEVTTFDLFDTKYLFKGYLILDDCSQLALPYAGVVTTLTASCHLGLLRDVPFTDDDGNVPKGMMRVAEILALCFKKTGLSLDINVINNLKHGTGELTNAATFSASGNYFVTDGLLTEFFYVGQRLIIEGTPTNNRTAVVTEVDNTGVITQVTLSETITTGESAPGAVFTDASSDGHFYEKIYLNASAFEEDDCYTVISKILGEDCRCGQYLGEWWIARIDEYDGNIMYPAEFDADGVFIGGGLAQDYLKSIGFTENAKFVFADNLMSIPRPLDSAKLSFTYSSPKIPINGDFEKGTVIDDSSSTEKTFVLDSWNLYKDLPSVTPIGNTAFVRETYNDLGYVDERYAVIGAGATESIYYLESQPVQVHQKDRIGISVDVRWDGNPETSAGFFRRNIAVVRLYADDGTFYTLHGGSSVDPRIYWQVTNSTFTTNRKYIHLELDGSDDDTEWMTATFMAGFTHSSDIPKNGYITVSLHAETKTNLFETHFNNLRLDYIPYINGTYTKYTGQYFKNEREEDGYFAKREQDVYVTDSPRKLLNGGFHFIQDEVEIFSGNARFVDDRTIILEGGDYTYDIEDYATIRVADSAFNNKIFRVQSKSFTIIGNETLLTVPRGITTEASNPVTIYKQIFWVTSRWWTAAPFALGSPTSLDSVKPYGKQQVDAVWNQYRNHIREFSSTVKGLGTNWPDFIHKYELTDSSPDTNDRFFLLVGFEQDFKSYIWRANFIEVYRTDGKVYDDPTEFKYVDSE